MPAGFFNNGSLTNTLVAANNVDFSGSPNPSPSMTTDGQLLIGHTSATTPNILVGTLVSPHSSITIGYSSPNITLDISGGGLAIDSIAVQTGTSPVVPTAAGLVTINGATVAAGTNPIRTNGTGANTLAVQVQISQALAATDATKIGLCNFNSAQFSVDANGFVSTAGSAAFPWSDTSGTVTATAFNGYFITATCTSTLPASPSEGDTISYCVDTTDILTITANTGQKIRLGTSLSISAGTCANTARGDSITLVYRTSGSTWFSVPGPQGNWNVQTS